MSLQSVKTFLAAHAPDIPVIELASSTATVTLAAEAHGVEPGRIAKTLSLRVGDDVVLLVTRGALLVIGDGGVGDIVAGVAELGVLIVHDQELALGVVVGVVTARALEFRI